MPRSNPICLLLFPRDLIDGLWAVQFQGPQGHGGGVVVLNRNQVLGGDRGFTYTGRTNQTATSLKQGGHQELRPERSERRGYPEFRSPVGRKGSGGFDCWNGSSLPTHHKRRFLYRCQDAALFSLVCGRPGRKADSGLGQGTETDSDWYRRPVDC